MPCRPKVLCEKLYNEINLRGEAGSHVRVSLINDTSQEIIHIDMDAFFAQVEMRMTPVLRTSQLYGHDP